MKINGWDIERADAYQWNVTPGFHDMKNESEWMPGSPVPVLFNGTLDFKELTVKLLVKTHGRQSILENVSTILSHLVEPVELELDRFPHRFRGVLTKYTHKEESLRRFHTLELKFDGYEYGTEIHLSKTTTDTDKALTVQNPGNMVTPVVLTLTSAAAVDALTIAGICRDVTGKELATTVRTMTAKAPVVLDGERGLFTENSAAKAKDIDIWALPTLKPGRNTLTVDRAGITMEARFKPRYM